MNANEEHQIEEAAGRSHCSEWSRRLRLHFSLAVVCLAFCGCGVQAGTFRIATYNVQGYLDSPTKTRTVKPAPAKAKICESILALKPDVLNLQEMGSASALSELRKALKQGGLDLPFCEQLAGPDTNIHLVLLSKLPC